MARRAACACFDRAVDEARANTAAPDVRKSVYPGPCARYETRASVWPWLSSKERGAARRDVGTAPVTGSVVTAVVAGLGKAVGVSSTEDVGDVVVPWPVTAAVAETSTLAGVVAVNAEIATVATGEEFSGVVAVGEDVGEIGD